MDCSITPNGRAVPRRMILLIDHEASVRDVLQVCLDDLGGWNVKAASTIWQGLILIEGSMPELILLDVPDIELCAEEVMANLRGHTSLGLVPVIFITSKAGWFSKAQLQSLGVAGALPKPFNPTALPDQIRALLPRPGSVPPYQLEK